MTIAFRQSSKTICRTLSFSGKGWFKVKNGRNQCSKSTPAVSFDQNLNLIQYARQRVNQLVCWYEEMSGLMDVRIAQEKVTDASDRLAELQEARRQAAAELNEIQSKLKQIYAELDNTKRGEDRYVQLISEENKLLKEEDVRQAKFKDAETAEREQFVILTSAVKNSHEKERFQSKKTQYWSLLGSIIGAVLGIIGTSINNQIRLTKLKELVRDSTHGDYREFLKTLKEIEHNFTSLSASGKNNNVDNASLEEMLTNINTRVVLAEEESRRMKYLVITVSLFCILMPLITNCLLR